MAAEWLETQPRSPITTFPAPIWMPKDKVAEQLEAADYTNIRGIHADDGHWEGKGIKNGKITEFHVDPHSGALLKEEVDND